MDAFQALADPTRRRVLATLAQQPRTAGALAAAESTSRPAVSRHLRVLRVAGLVRVTAAGRERRYELDRAGLAPVTTFLEELRPAAGERPSLASLAAGRLDALELEVRRTVREGRAAQSAVSATQSPARAPQSAVSAPQSPAPSGRQREHRPRKETA